MSLVWGPASAEEKSSFEHDARGASSAHSSDAVRGAWDDFSRELADQLQRIESALRRILPGRSEEEPRKP